MNLYDRNYRMVYLPPLDKMPASRIVNTCALISAVIPAYVRYVNQNDEMRDDSFLNLP
jgi:hypothetical protein